MKTLHGYNNTNWTYKVYILPLRNENLLKRGMRNFLMSLYPTFKEWKHAFLVNSKSCIFICLYPTFKEWKPSNSTITKIATTSLYPTFKEWKQFLKPFFF